MQTIYSVCSAGALAGAAFWFGAMLWLRARIWSSPTLRKVELPVDKDFSQDFKYHNEAIYRDFEYFFKVTLALLGGIAYIATRPEPLEPKVREALLSSAAGLQLVSGVIFSLFVFFHQKSKMERWKTYFTWWEPLTWQECWMVSGMLAISGGVAFSAIPSLLAILAKISSHG